MDATLSHRQRLPFWGWGYADEVLSGDEERRLEATARMLAPGGYRPVTPPRAQDFSLRDAGLAVPANLAAQVSTTPYDCLTHAYGKSWADGARMLLRQLPPQPLLVGFPRSEQDIADLLDWAAGEGAALIAGHQRAVAA